MISQIMSELTGLNPEAMNLQFYFPFMKISNQAPADPNFW